MFGNIGDAVPLLFFGLAAMLAMPALAVVAALLLPSGHSRGAFILCAIGVSGPVFALAIHLQKQLLEHSFLLLFVAEITIFFALMPLWLYCLVRWLPPSSLLNRALGLVGAIGLIASGFGLYAFFVH